MSQKTQTKRADDPVNQTARTHQHYNTKRRTEMQSTQNDDQLVLSKSFCKALVQFLLLMSSDIICQITEDRKSSMSPSQHANPMRYQNDVRKLAAGLLEILRD